MLYDDNHIKEEVYKCSKCALCKSVCPVFSVLKNELFLSRGRFIILNNFYNNKKKPSYNFIKNLDVCLNCNLCKKFCPSDIDSAYIFNYFKFKFNYKYFIFNFSSFYFLYLNLIKFLPKKITCIRKKCANGGEKGKILYFEGCYNKYVNPSDKNAVLNVLEYLGYEVKTVSYCCGYPYLNEGSFKKYNNNIQLIINELNSYDYDYLITSCDSCYDMLSKNEVISKKLIRFDKFIELNNVAVDNGSDVCYFMPLVRDYSCNKLLGIQKVKLGVFSLMENLFALKYKKYSKKLLKILKDNINSVNENTIITTCNLSYQGLSRINSNKKILTYAQYIEMNYKDKK